MTITPEIRKAFRTVLLEPATLTLLGLTAEQFQWEGRPFSTPDNNFYVRETLKPNDSSLKTIPARGGRVRHSGVYLLDCFRSVKEPVNTLDTLADLLVATLWHGRVLVRDSGTVTVSRVSRMGALPPKADIRMVPVTISYYTDTHNP